MLQQWDEFLDAHKFDRAGFSTKPALLLEICTEQVFQPVLFPVAENTFPFTVNLQSGKQGLQGNGLFRSSRRWWLQ